MNRVVNRATGLIAVAVVAAVTVAAAAIAYAQGTTHLNYGGPSKGQTAMAQVTFTYPTRWEYGRFRYSPMQTGWSWRSGPENIQGDATTLWRKLDGPQRTTAGDIWYGEVLTIFGQQGWEVAVMRDYEAGSEVWLRRPAK